MTQSGVSAFARLARWFALSAVLLLASAGALAAQTGKIEGKVRDQAGAPIRMPRCTSWAPHSVPSRTPRATTSSTTSRPVPSRSAASFIGYKKTEVDGVKRARRARRSRRTSSSRPATVVIEELTVVAAENPLVPRDEVTTKQRIDGQIDAGTAGRPRQPGAAAAAGRGGRRRAAARSRSAAVATTRRRSTSTACSIAAGPPRQRLRGSAAARACRATPTRVGTNQFEEDLGDDGCGERRVRQRAVGHRQPVDPHGRPASSRAGSRWSRTRCSPNTSSWASTASRATSAARSS